MYLYFLYALSFLPEKLLTLLLLFMNVIPVLPMFVLSRLQLNQTTIFSAFSLCAGIYPGKCARDLQRETGLCIKEKQFFTLNPEFSFSIKKLFPFRWQV